MDKRAVNPVSGLRMLNLYEGLSGPKEKTESPPGRCRCVVFLKHGSALKTDY